MVVWDSFKCQGEWVSSVLICIVILDTPHSPLVLDTYTAWVIATLWSSLRLAQDLCLHISYLENTLVYLGERACVAQEREREREGERERQTDRQTERDTERETERQTERQIVSNDYQTHGTNSIIF